MITMRRLVTLLQIAFLLSSCQRQPARVGDVLRESGNNRAELEKVLAHYKTEPDKLRAAYFLIGNMSDHYTLAGEEMKHYAGIFSVLDSLHRNSIPVPITSPVLAAAWDSLVRTCGIPMRADMQQLPDHRTIKADFLIQHIDSCMFVWKSSPWCKGLSFEDFCEYILPYRAATEAPEAVHAPMRKRFSLLRDTSKAKDRYGFTEQFNQHARAFMGVSNMMRLYPFDISISQMEKGKRGSCEHLAQFEMMALRANGVPAAIDYVPMWGDLNRGHTWNVVLKEDGTTFPFDATAAIFGGIYTYPYRFCKVYRRTFAAQPQTLPPNQEVPENLVHRNEKDVTELYNRVSDLEISLTKKFELPREYAVICTFRTTGWSAQSYGPIKNNKASFKKMGRNLLYIVMYFYQGRYYPATEPFILDKEGQLRYVSISSQTQKMTLLRKYPCFPFSLNHMKAMIGGRFQGANKADFSDSVNLYTVTQMPEKIESVEISGKRPFRYLRFIPSHGVRANIAELQFIGRNGKPLKGSITGFPDVSQAETGTALVNAFDGNVETYFSGIKDGICWAGLDLGRPQQVCRIRYCPRSDSNFILEGDEYELCFWNGEEWKSAGKQIAKGQELQFGQVPSGGVYILHNLTRGNEERIFTYENGKQIWW